MWTYGVIRRNRGVPADAGSAAALYTLGDPAGMFCGDGGALPDDRLGCGIDASLFFAQLLHGLSFGAYHALQ